MYSFFFFISISKNKSVWCMKCHRGKKSLLAYPSVKWLPRPKRNLVSRVTHLTAPWGEQKTLGTSLALALKGHSPIPTCNSRPLITKLNDLENWVISRSVNGAYHSSSASDNKEIWCSESFKPLVCLYGSSLDLRYGLYRYVPRNRVWFLRISAFK